MPQPSAARGGGLLFGAPSKGRGRNAIRSPAALDAGAVVDAVGDGRGSLHGWSVVHDRPRSGRARSSERSPGFVLGVDRRGLRDYLPGPVRLAGTFPPEIAGWCRIAPAKAAPRSSLEELCDQAWRQLRPRPIQGGSQPARRAQRAQNWGTRRAPRVIPNPAQMRIPPRSARRRRRARRYARPPPTSRSFLRPSSASDRAATARIANAVTANAGITDEVGARVRPQAASCRWSRTTRRCRSRTPPRRPPPAARRPRRAAVASPRR